MGIFKKIGNAVSSAFPLVSTAGSLASTLLTNRANRRRQNEMNEYNSPAAQLERYKQAGINPGYGSGVSTGNQSSVVQAQAPDVGAAVDSGAKAIAWKEHQQNIRNSQLQGQKLAAEIRNQNVVATLAEQTLATHAEAEHLKTKGLIYQNVGQLAEANLKSIDSENMQKLKDSALNPRMLDYLTKSSILKKIGLETLGADISNKLKQQQYDFLKKSNQIHYQLDAQKFKQLEIINPLDAAIQKLRASGVSFSDPLMLRLMMLSNMQGQGYYGSQLIGPAMIDYTKNLIPKFW